MGYKCAYEEVLRAARVDLQGRPDQLEDTPVPILVSVCFQCVLKTEEAAGSVTKRDEVCEKEKVARVLPCKTLPEGDESDSMRPGRGVGM